MLGIVLSVLYIFLMWWIFGDRIGALKSMDLNAVGDFLAGAFSPLAFLWLVLGYRQQGRELAHSSESLRLQTKELAASVEQQKALVLAQKEQLLNHNRSIEPILTLKYIKVGQVDGAWGHHLSIKNSGSYCDQVRVVLSHSEIDEFIVEFDYIDSKDERIFFVEGVGDVGPVYDLVVSYKRMNGSAGYQCFEIYRCSNDEYGDEYGGEGGEEVTVSKLPLL